MHDTLYRIDNKKNLLYDTENNIQHPVINMIC